MNAVVGSTLARLASFLPTAAATLLATRLLLQHYGVGVFDSYGLIISLINLIPLNNLGLGASVTTAIAAHGPDAQLSRRTVRTATRVLLVSTLVTSALSAALTVLTLWPRLLGAASGPNLWCGVAIIVYALSFVPGIGASILLGLHRNHVTIVIQAFFNPVATLLIVGAIAFGVGGGPVLVAPSLALLAVNVATTVVARRASGISISRAVRVSLKRRRWPGASIRALSGPMLVITLFNPIALYSDRIILSHVSTKAAVAQYTVVMLILAPTISLIASAAQPLWPVYAAARAQNRPGPNVLAVFGGFIAVGAVGGAVLGALAAPIGVLVSGGHGHVHISVLLAVASGLGMLTSAASYPISVTMMYPAAARFLLWFTLVALPLNVALSIVLGRHLGAPGPLLASCAVGLLVQALPGLIYSRRAQNALRVRRPRPNAGGRHAARGSALRG